MQDFGLEITPRPDLPAIVARWQREITESELQHGYLGILAAGDALGCWRWLLDLRRRDELASPALAAWVNAEFFPRLRHRYAAPVRIAFLISPLRAATGQSASSVAAISATPRPEQDFQTALFTDEATAYRWLAIDP
ncbi:hypothetical protein [Hymenobacter negativus]|uniref:STAS/SEC14 domain-containing protein n=1 Tax=Hymenobacter negativus TaxID=2795026 RepID=A0ABS0Q915_9BACT|nr:hypothetical protein [Hymenobacter negativus]MBH8559160.1 hypothetical protein [Hymenobacter negativus]